MDHVERLCHVLGEETRLCGELAGVLRDEQQAVVRLRPEAILTCLERRETIQDRLVDLARERRDVVRAMAAARGTAATRATEMLPFLSHEPQSRVRDHLRRLRGALLQARGLERQNAQLVGANLDTVTDLLRALRALVPGARYGADAEVAVPAAPEALDRRA
jgi:flagellar biosynthesis/type III secretory pathway chaperone